MSEGGRTERSTAKFLVIHTDPNLHPLDSPMQARLEDLGARIAPFWGDSDDFGMVAAEADAILNADFRITALLISLLRRCRVISRFGIGVDNIDVDAATARGIPVANVPEFCTEEVANRTFTLLLACASQLLQLDRRVREGEWRGGQLPETVQIDGQVLGLVGFGRIARAVARRGRAFDRARPLPYALSDRTRGSLSCQFRGGALKIRHPLLACSSNPGDTSSYQRRDTSVGQAIRDPDKLRSRGPY
jgi:hypothetical protein